MPTTQKPIVGGGGERSLPGKQGRQTLECMKTIKEVTEYYELQYRGGDDQLGGTWMGSALQRGNSIDVGP